MRLDTPAGLVEARVAVEDGRARSVTLRNVPELPARRATGRSTCPGSGRVRYDMAFGGNFYALIAGGRRRAGGRPGAARRS